MTKADARAEIQKLQQAVAVHGKHLRELMMKTENLKCAIESLRRQSDVAPHLSEAGGTQARLTPGEEKASVRPAFFLSQIRCLTD